ncbi:MAG: TrkA family potassium uptake protein [Candidatus Hadarchaeota archaeon]
MKQAKFIIVAGGGRVGFDLAKALVEQGKDVVVIEKDPAVCERIASEMNALVINGDATNKKILEDARIQGADVFVAVTGNDSENIVASQLAKHSYGVPLVLARIEDPDRAKAMEGMGIDLIVRPAHVAAMVLENAIVLPGTTSVLVSGTTTRAVEAEVSEDSRVKEKRIADLSIPANCVMAAIYRKGKLIIPRGDTVLKAGDMVALIGEEAALRKLVDMLRG